MLNKREDAHDNHTDNDNKQPDFPGETGKSNKKIIFSVFCFPSEVRNQHFDIPKVKWEPLRCEADCCDGIPFCSLNHLWVRGNNMIWTSCKILIWLILDRYDQKIQFLNQLLMCTALLHFFFRNLYSNYSNKTIRKSKHITYILCVILMHFVQITIFALYLESAKYEVYIG